MVHAVYANVRRGLDYSYGDKQQILERLLADPEIAQLGDRALAQDLSMSHMTVWRTRARLAEEARLQAEIAAMPATATAPKAREQEQLAAYLAVPVEALKIVSARAAAVCESRGHHQEPRRYAVYSTPQQAAARTAQNVERADRVDSGPRERANVPR